MKIIDNTRNGEVALEDVKPGAVIEIDSIREGSGGETVIAVVTRQAGAGQRSVVDLYEGRVLNVDACTTVRVFPEASVYLNQKGR